MALLITDRCKGCTACAKVCPVAAITGERGQVHTVNARRCVSCEVCGRVCPFGAIEREDGTQVAAVKRSLWKHPVIDKTLCTACRMCAAVCTAGALDVERPRFAGDYRVTVFLAAPQKCVGCGLCQQECPMDAITMEEPS